jgi:hypothetical protein
MLATYDEIPSCADDEMDRRPTGIFAHLVGSGCRLFLVPSEDVLLEQ